MEKISDQNFCQTLCIRTDTIFKLEFGFTLGQPEPLIPKHLLEYDKVCVEEKKASIVTKQFTFLYGRSSTCAFHGIEKKISLPELSVSQLDPYSMLISQINFFDV